MSTLNILNATEQELNSNVSWSSSFQLLAAYLTTEYFNNISSVLADEIILENYNSNNNNNNNNNLKNNNYNKNNINNLTTIIDDYGTIINTKSNNNNNSNDDDDDDGNNDIYNNIINDNNIIITNNNVNNINIGTDIIPINNYDLNINFGSYIGININDTININNITNYTISTIEKSIRNDNIANIINNAENTITGGSTTTTTSGSGGSNSGSSTTGSTTGMGNLQISLYAIIFMLAIVGNLLVILTLVQNRRMRTITNLFLLNLAISDILLGVLCMPPTLVGALLRDFIFGRFMCKVLPYLQACSVSVSAWTLVAISCERYYAICHPLRSRTWQTLKHAYKLIALIWIGSLFLLSPIAYLSKLIPTAKGGHKCREEWPTSWKQPYEKIFNIYLDIILLIIPVLVLTLTYSLISRTLWHGMRAEKAPKGTQSTDNLMEVFINKNGSPSNRSFVSYRTASKDNLNLVGNLHQFNGNNSFMQNPMIIKEFSYSTRRKHGLRRTNIEKSLQNKKRVIKMLFMVVLEFFLCWTPLYVINTIALFSPDLIYSSIGYAGISFFQLLAYSSSCCNPITYCFMNRGFRKAFLNLFRCFKRFRSPKRKISIGGGGTQETDLEISRLQCQRLCTDSTISY